MNKFLSISSIMIIVLLSPIELQSQWKQINVGSPGANLWAVAVAGSNVFAGSAGGIFKSTNDGATWTNVSSIYTRCFTVKGSKIFAGTYDKGVIVSSDNGETWIQRDSGFTGDIEALAIKDSIIFAAGGGMYRSTDDGVSWTTIQNGLGYGETTVSGLAITEGKVLASTFAGVAFSTDNGDNWSDLVGTDQTNGVTNCVAAIDSTVLIGWNGGVIRSTDDGRSWIEGSSWISTSTTFCFVGDSSRIYAGTTTGVHLSSDGGVTWAPINNGLPGNQVFSMATEGTILFATTYSHGVYRSIDSGASWTSASAGIVQSEVNSIAGSGPNIYAVLEYDSLYSSTDNGTTWTADTSLHTGGIISSTVIGQEVYAMTHSGIFISSDNGKTWNTINGGVMDSIYPSLLVQSGSNLISATQERGRVFLSSDNGTTWDNVGQNLPELASLTVSGSNVVAGSQSGIYISTDNGETWTNVTDTLININALATVGSDIFAGRYRWPYPLLSPPSPPGGVFRSTDGGSTWAPFSSGIPFDPQVYAVAAHGGNIFAGSEPGLYFSTITGNNWVNIGQGLPEGKIMSLYVNDSSVFVGTEISGIWWAPLSALTGVKQLTAMTIPTSFQLKQNFPNPFNPSTTISYQLSEASNVKLNVYDILGRQVAALIDGKQNPGNYKVRFDASKMASGVYFYRFEVKNYAATRKMAVIK